MQALYKLGVPSAIALYLVYSLVNGGSTILAKIDQSQQMHISDTNRQTDLLREIKEGMLRMERYQHLTCLNTATNHADRANCDSR